MTIHPYASSLVWTAAGFTGLVLRLWLLGKFLTDLRLAQYLRLDSLRQSVTQRAVESTTLHCLLKLGIITLGLASMTQPPGPSVEATPYAYIVTGFLLLIPVALAGDAVRELAFQWRLIREVHQSYSKERTVGDQNQPAAGDLSQGERTTHPLVRGLGEMLFQAGHFESLADATGSVQQLLDQNALLAGEAFLHTENANNYLTDADWRKAKTLVNALNPALFRFQLARIAQVTATPSPGEQPGSGRPTSGQENSPTPPSASSTPG